MRTTPHLRPTQVGVASLQAPNPMQPLCVVDAGWEFPFEPSMQQGLSSSSGDGGSSNGQGHAQLQRALDTLAARVHALVQASTQVSTWEHVKSNEAGHQRGKRGPSPRQSLIAVRMVLSLGDCSADAPNSGTSLVCRALLALYDGCSTANLPQVVAPMLQDGTATTPRPTSVSAAPPSHPVLKQALTMQALCAALLPELS